MAATRNRERVLLLQMKRIGDFILTAPAVAALRAAKPDAEIVAVVPSMVAEIATCIAAVDRVHAYRPRSLNLGVWAAIASGPWDACVDFAGTDRTALMSRLSRATVRVGYKKFADSASKALAYTQLCEASVRDLHTVEFHLELVRALVGNAIAAPSPAFSLPPASDAWARGALSAAGIRSAYAVVHPGTAREEKLWNAGRWAEVIAHISKEEGLKVLLTGSNEGIERAHLAELRSALRVPVVDLAGELSLLQTAAVIHGAELVLGVDSMAMHLASMFRRPQVVLFGPTNPFHWRPTHERAAVVMAGQAAAEANFTPRAVGAEMNLISTAQTINAMRAVRKMAAQSG